MFNATAQMNIAKIRRNFAASNLCAKRTPKGVVINVMAMINPKATRFTAPSE
jgi:hypothetical protein